MDLTVGSRHCHLSVLLFLGVALALCWYFARDDGLSSALDHWLAAGRQEVQTAAKYRWDVRALSGQVATHLHHEAKLARDTTRLRQARDSALAAAFLLTRSVDSLHRAPLTAAVRRIGEACGEAIDTCERRAGLFAQTLEPEHARANLALARAAHADSVIATGLRVTDCRW